MNIFSIFGFLIAIAVLMGGLMLSSKDLSIFLDYPSMFIVLGGSFAATSISFQLNRIFTLFKIFFRRILLGKKEDLAKTVEEVLRFSDEIKKGQEIKSLITKTKDFFLKESLEMIDEGILDAGHIVSVLQNRNDNIMTHNMNEANKIKTVSKFPPAFGMIGTTIGMIVLLANLGGADAMKMIGPAMGVCLITTMYGAVIANLIVTPVAENLIEGSKETYQKNQIIIKGVELINLKTNPIIVAEELNSFLSPKDRLDWRKILNS